MLWRVFRPIVLVDTFFTTNFFYDIFCCCERYLFGCGIGGSDGSGSGSLIAFPWHALSTPREQLTTMRMSGCAQVHFHNLIGLRTRLRELVYLHDRHPQLSEVSRGDVSWTCVLLPRFSL